jgi:hypothetical protein
MRLQMRLEEGKYYRTGDGQKVKCVAVSTMDHGVEYGAIIATDCYNYLSLYTVDGYYFSSKVEHVNNIVSKWKEPKKHSAKAHLWSDGRLTGDFEKIFVPGNAKHPYVVESRTIEWEVGE